MAAPRMTEPNYPDPNDPIKADYRDRVPPAPSNNVTWASGSQSSSRSELAVHVFQHSYPPSRERQRGSNNWHELSGTYDTDCAGCAVPAGEAGAVSHPHFSCLNVEAPELASGGFCSCQGTTARRYSFQWHFEER